MKKIVVIGGGIVGLAVAWKLAGTFPDSRVVLLEKEDEVGRHQSGNNSGVLHCGLYYRSGSLKARLAVYGIREMVAFCERHGIAHEVCGKLVVATNDLEVSRLDALEERGRRNGLTGIRRLKREQIAEREPNAAGIEALEVPQEGIVDFAHLCRVLVDCLEDNGHEIRLSTRVLSGGLRNGKVRLHTVDGEVEADYAVNCAGLHSDRVCRQLGGRPSVKIVPFRGEYFKLKSDRQDLVKHLIYPVPDPAFPFLGVHFSRLIHGGVEAGPNAVLAFSREGYRKTDVDAGDLAETLLFPGLWKFAAKYSRMCVSELMQSFSRKRFCKSLQKLVPSVQESDLETGGAGVRAQAMTSDGRLVEDFALVENERMIHVQNAPSPAATASLAIADEVVGRICRQVS